MPPHHIPESPLVQSCALPPSSALQGHWTQKAYFQDAHRTALHHRCRPITEIFTAIFAHHPWWMKAALMLRNFIACRAGLDAPTAAQLMNFEIKQNYRVGEHIGVWPIIALTANELIVGRNGKHLDFRLSVLKESAEQATHVTVSTLCIVHNGFGKVYLFFIRPMHHWGVQWLLTRANLSGRL